MASSTLDDSNETLVKPVDLAKLADDSVDAVVRGIDPQGRLTLEPAKAVKAMTLTRGLAMAAETRDQLLRAIDDPVWARAELALLVADLANASARRSREDHEAEAAVLATLVGQPGGRA